MPARCAHDGGVDGYSSYIKQISDARTADLRREAADYALSSIARRRRRVRWARAIRSVVPTRMPAPQPLLSQTLASSSAPSSR